MSDIPIEAIFLGIDAAKHTSGAALLLPDYGGMDEEDEHPFEGNYYLAEFGKVESQSERNRFVDSLVEHALDLELPAVVVAEAWDPPRHKKRRLAEGGWGVVLDQKWTPKTVFGMGEGWGRWMAEIETANEYLQEEGGEGIILMTRKPNEWRPGIFPAPLPKRSEDLKAMAMNFFEAAFGYKASSDISEAACLALYGAHSQEIADTLKQRQKKRGKKKR